MLHLAGLLTIVCARYCPWYTLPIDTCEWATKVPAAALGWRGTKGRRCADPRRGEWRGHGSCPARHTCRRDMHRHSWLPEQN